MVQDSITYYVWIGGSCDYGHKERAGGATFVLYHNGSTTSTFLMSVVTGPAYPNIVCRQVLRHLFSCDLKQ